VSSLPLFRLVNALLRQNGLEHRRERVPSATGNFVYKGRGHRKVERSRTTMDAKTDGRAGSEPRLEDDVLVRGHGRFMADAPLPDQAYACFVRSPHALARALSEFSPARIWAMSAASAAIRRWRAAAASH
jgi:hypothetical protein